MQNSSFLFNYDSEDSSAHYSSSYQFNSSNQPETGGNADTGNADGATKQEVQQTAAHDNHPLSAPEHPISGPPPENERDGAVNKKVVVIDEQTSTESERMLAEDAQLENVLLEDVLPAEQANEMQLDPRNAQVVPEDSERMDAQTVWQNALSELALQVSTATYDTWLRDTSVIAYEDGEFIIGLPNAYAQDWLTNRFMPKIKRVLVRLVGRSVHVTFRVVPTAVVDAQNAEPTPLYDTHYNAALSQSDLQDPLQKDNLTHAPTPTQGSGGRDAQSTPVSDENDMTQHTVPLDRRDSLAANNLPPNDLGSRPTTVDNFNLPPVNGGNHDSGPFHGGFHHGGLNQSGLNQGSPYQSGAYQSGTYQGMGESGLQSGYTFDTFIVGSHNQLAHAAAASISDGPGHSFNPLFIYGGVGLGKTHLLHAVGNAAAAKGSRVLYCTSEQFTNELISSIRGRGTDEFRSKYRQVDVLLIDDIQFIAGKESTQEEFFHTFNHLHNLGRQVVLSSDRPPRSLATLEERLRSRFEGGLLTDISPPDFETRVAILQSKANKSGIRIHMDVLMLVAERVDSNIRELEGALNRMVVQAKLFSGTLDLPLAENILRNLAPQRSPCSPQSVVRIVAEHFHLTEEDLFGRSRTKEIAHARQTAMYLLREENAMSLPSIGDLLGGRDHSTVRHGVEKITNVLEQDEQLRREIMTLRDKIYSAPEMGS